MNEQERLQRTIDILTDNAHEMCAVEGDSNDIILDANMDGVQMVAKEIAAIFKQPQKDTRSRRERKLDEQFAAMDVKPMIYHFVKEVKPFKAITIADECMSRKTMVSVLDKVFEREYLWMRKDSPATRVIQSFILDHVYGVAICDKSDRFSKRYGRMKAKGRLLQHLLKEAQKK